jgi:hypothetical protein
LHFPSYLNFPFYALRHPCPLPLPTTT